MTQEEKQLLLQDLSARLSYNVKIAVNDKVETLQGINVLDNVAEYSSCLSSDIEKVKPYLFPLSSMTEEQKREFDISMDMEYAVAYNAEVIYANRMIDFFNKNHLDYRGLIPMGLATDATGLNIY